MHCARIPRLVVAIGVIAVACDSGASSRQQVPAPFPDSEIGDVADFGPPGTITELRAGPAPSLDFVAVTRTDGTIDLFDRKDPNIGCRLTLASDETWDDAPWLDPDAVFVDQCRGSQYDEFGQPLHDAKGPPMWQLRTYVDDGTVYIDRSEVRAAFYEQLEGHDRGDVVDGEPAETPGVEPTGTSDGEPFAFEH